MLRKSIFSFAMVGIAVLAVASSGGGDKKNAKSSFPSANSSLGFTLKAGPSYQARLGGASSQFNFTNQNALVTYRKGNTIYIVPAVAKVSRQSAKSNLSLLSWRMKLHK